MKKFLYIFLTFFITSSAFANQPVDWQLGFQQAASETMREIVNFHDKLSRKLKCNFYKRALYSY